MTDLNSRARRLARKTGLVARKSRRPINLDNLGEFALIDIETNCIVQGSRYDLSAEDVIVFCGGQLPEGLT